MYRASETLVRPAGSMSPTYRNSDSGARLRHSSRKKLYERINFLPFADAMFSGVAIVIIIFINYAQKSPQDISRPQADIILQCEDAAAGNYTVHFLKADPPAKPAVLKTVAKAEIEHELKARLGAWPELSARLLVQETTGNRGCTEALNGVLETLRESIVRNGRTGLAVPIYSTLFLDDVPTAAAH
jgi:hypothetical protein